MVATFTPSIRSTLTLYKKLLRYSNCLKFTDVEYYKHRVRQEFRKYKSLQDPEKARFQYQVKLTQK